MKTTIFSRILMTLAVCLCLSALGRPAYASDSGGGSLWGTIKGFGSDIVDTITEEGPGWVASAKQKGGELIGGAKDAVVDARDSFADWNARQEDEFWARTESMLGGGTTTPTTEEPPQQTQTQTPTTYEYEPPRSPAPDEIVPSTTTNPDTPKQQTPTTHVSEPPMTTPTTTPDRTSGTPDSPSVTIVDNSVHNTYNISQNTATTPASETRATHDRDYYIAVAIGAGVTTVLLSFVGYFLRDRLRDY